MKSQLILVPSNKMDSNRKDNRNEDKLIRMGEKARANLGLTNDKAVELWPDNSDVNGKINHNRLALIFQAYSKDLKELKNSGMSEEEYNRVGFVTTRTFKFICGGKNVDKENIWLADSIEDTVIGADPEFILIQKESGDIQYASNVPEFGFEGQLGSDGPLAEVRPDPAVNIKDFVNNIQKVLKSNPKRDYIMKYDWIGGCFFNSLIQNREFGIGGHAHIGTPAQVAEILNRDAGSNTRSMIFACLQKILDEYISIPMLKVEGKDDGVRRRHHYGRFGDYRTDHGRLEYRTLSGMWLVHPELAKCTMGAVKAVSHAFFKLAESKDYASKLFTAGNMSQNFDPYSLFDQRSDMWKNIEIVKAMKALRSATEMIDILDKGVVRFDKDFISDLKKKFRSLSTYNMYAKFIDMFIELVSLPSLQLKKIDKNIKHNWLEGKEFII